MENEINNLAIEIGLPVNQLRQYLPPDEPTIADYMQQGYQREQAEDMGFVDDLDNVINMMNKHAISPKSAVNMLKRHEMGPWNYTSLEDEEEAEEEEEEERAEEEKARGWKRGRRDDSSDDEGNEKRIKLDPDLVVSECLHEDT
jgi:hypothetical protein